MMLATGPEVPSGGLGIVCVLVGFLKSQLQSNKYRGDGIYTLFGIGNFIQPYKLYRLSTLAAVMGERATKSGQTTEAVQTSLADNAFRIKSRGAYTTFRYMSGLRSLPQVLGIQLLLSIEDVRQPSRNIKTRERRPQPAKAGFHASSSAQSPDSF